MKASEMYTHKYIYSKQQQTTTPKYYQKNDYQE